MAAEEVKEEPVMLEDFHGGGTGATCLELSDDAVKDAEIETEALRQYKDGTVFEYILKTCEERHVCTSEEERNVLKVLICSCASMQISNCCGINPNILGEAGIGKSDSAKTVASTYPLVVDGYLSKTALQHMKGLEPMNIILRDDQAMTGDTVDLFNASLSNWDEDYTMRITNPKTHVVEPLTIPRRCARWTIYAHGTGNDQNHDRQIFLHPDGSKEQRQSVHNKMADEAVDPFRVADNTRIDVCKRIWSKFIVAAPYYVQIPFAHRISCDEGEGNRTFKMMLCLTMCFALMAKEKRMRIPSPDGKLEAIVATEDDFKEASKIMNKLVKGQGGSQKHKLSPNGEKILSFLMYPPKEFKDSTVIGFSSVRDWLKISASALSRCVESLLEIVGIGIDTEGNIKAPAAKAFVVNREAFFSWDGSHGIYSLDDSKGDTKPKCQLDPAEEEYLYQSYMQTTEVKE